MADKRMFSKVVTESDSFTDLPLSTQALYFHLNMNADDDGFVNNPKKITRILGCKVDDLERLITEEFIIRFESGVVVVKHWRVNNLIRKDRYKPTAYKKEAALLVVEDGIYNTVVTVGIPNDNHLATQDRLGKDRLGKDRIEKDICPEPEAAPDSIQVISLILNDKSEFAIYQSQVDKWAKLYPSVDVMQELRNMAGWLDANVSRRKTKRGILKFVNNWLSKAQDQGRTYQKPKERTNKFNNFNQRDYDYGQLERGLLERDLLE